MGWFISLIIMKKKDRTLYLCNSLKKLIMCKNGTFYCMLNEWLFIKWADAATWFWYVSLEKKKVSWGYPQVLKYFQNIYDFYLKILKLLEFIHLMRQCGVKIAQHRDSKIAVNELWWWIKIQ